MVRVLTTASSCAGFFFILLTIGTFPLNARGESAGIASVNDKPLTAQGTIKKVSIDGGTVTTLASGLDKPFAPVIYEDHVYFAEIGTGAIKKVSIDGGEVITLANELHHPRGLRVDEGWVYFTETGAGAVKKVSINGGKIITVAKGLVQPRKITVDSKYIYVCEYVANGAIQKIPKHATNARPVALIKGVDFPFAGVLIDKNIFLIEHTLHGRLLQISTEDGTATVLSQNLRRPTLGDSDRTHLYFLTEDTIQKIPIAGGDATVLVSNLRAPGGGPIVDEENVYFADNLTTIKKVSKNGGTPVTIADGFHDVFAMTLHANNLYLTEGYVPSRDKEFYP